MASGGSLTFMLSAPPVNPMMDDFSFSIQKMLVAFSMFTKMGCLFISVHLIQFILGLLLSAKLTTACTRSIKAEVMVVIVPPRKEGPCARRWRRPEHGIGQGPLHLGGFIPWRAPSCSSRVVRITGIALGWIGPTTPFGTVVRK